MKCKLRREIKDFIFVTIALILVLLITVGVFLILGTLFGYILAQGFNFYEPIYATSAFDYYAKLGGGWLFISIVLGLFIFLGLGIIYNIYKELKRFKWSWRNIKGLIIECK